MIETPRMTDELRLEWIEKHLSLHGPNPHLHGWVFVPGPQADLRATIDQLIEKSNALDTSRIKE